MTTHDSSFGRQLLCFILALFLCTVCASAQFGRPRPAKSPMKTDNFTYNGQTYQIVVLNGQPIQVKLNNQIVLMISNGVVMGYPGLDAGLIDGAKAALKAYETANGITPPGTPPGTAPAAPTSTASQPPAPTPASSLTVDGVVSMLDAGLSDNVILMKIRSSGATFDLSTDDLIRLKKAKASDTVMKAMMEAKPTAPPSGAVAPPQLPPPATAVSPAKTDTPASADPAPKKDGFLGSIGHGVTDVMNGRTVIDKIGLRNILPEWDPQKSVAEQFPHVAITVLSTPSGWMDPYETDKNAAGLQHYSFLFQVAGRRLDGRRAFSKDCPL